MSLAIVLVCLVFYLGLAVVIGRFCGINSAWERAVRDVGWREAASDSLSNQEIEGKKLDEAERILRRTRATTQVEESDPAAQTV